jgi:hypothetical protein
VKDVFLTLLFSSFFHLHFIVCGTTGVRNAARLQSYTKCEQSEKNNDKALKNGMLPSRG